MATEQGTTRYLTRVASCPGFPFYANFEKPIIKMLEESKVECLLEVSELWTSKYNWIKSRSRHDTDSIKKQRTESSRTISVSSVFVRFCTETGFISCDFLAILELVYSMSVRKNIFCVTV